MSSDKPARPPLFCLDDVMTTSNAGIDFASRFAPRLLVDPGASQTSARFLDTMSNHRNWWDAGENQQLPSGTSKIVA